MKKKKLVILTTHFGTNFSGGSTATCEIFSRIESEFESIKVVGTRLGTHPFQALTFSKYRTWMEALQILKKIPDQDTVFYGDFYNSFLFILARKKFYFTYHDSWPEQRIVSWANKFRSIWYTNIYRAIFRYAERVITVSAVRQRQVERFADKVRLIRNGFKVIGQQRMPRNHFIMVGNVTRNKYRKALDVFEHLSQMGFASEIHIYGHPSDTRLSNKLSEFPFVKQVPFQSHIPYGKFKALIHTSMAENLPIVICEALSASIPAVAFEVGGIPETLGKESGFVIPAYDSKVMAKKIIKLDQQNISFDFSAEDLHKRFNWKKASMDYLSVMA